MAHKVNRGQVDLVQVLRKTEADALKSHVIDIRLAFKIAKEECQFPELGVIWQDTLEPDSNGIQLCEDDDCVDPQAVGHALVQSAAAGLFHCVQAFRAEQAKKHSSSFLTGRFAAYAFLKAVEAGNVEVVKELSKPIDSASLALMGYGVHTMYKTGHYPYVMEPLDGVGIDWMKKMAAAHAMLPKAMPSVQITGSWELRGPKGSSLAVDKAIQAVYKSYFLWRTSIIAASNDKVAVFQELLGQMIKDNADIAEAGHEKGEAKKILAIRSKLCGLYYSIIEELSAIQRKDGNLYSLWTFIPGGSPQAPAVLAVRRHPNASGTHCVAQAQNGLWEIRVEIPVLMMQVEAGFVEEDPIKRLKQLDPVFPQRVTVNVQLVVEVNTLPNCIEATLSIKHVRMKVENSVWDDQKLGHFPSQFTIAVTPQTSEGGSCTMSNSSSNITFKVGTSENISGRVGVAAFVSAGTFGGIRGSVGGSAGKSNSSTMKSTPWRFEQIQVSEDKGGSYVWNLQSMKGLDFNKLNAGKMAEGVPIWKWGRRVPANPIAQLPFTSEGGINFTAASNPDTLTWRFPKSMDGTKLRWTIEGRFHCSFTTTKYWETREATFSGMVEETLKALEVKDKDKDKKGKGESGDGDGEKKKKDKKGGEDGEGDGEKKKKKKEKKMEEDEEDNFEKTKKEKNKIEEDEDDDVHVKKPKKKKPVAEEEEDEDDDVHVKKPKKKKPVAEEEEEKPKKKKPVAEEEEEKHKKKKPVAEEEEDEDDDVHVKKPKKKKPVVEEEEDEDDDVHVKKPKKKKPVAEEEEDEDDDVHVKKPKKKKPVAEEEEDEDDPPVKKPKKKKPVAEDEEDEDDTPMKKPKKKKPVAEEEDEDDIPVKKTKKKKPVVEEDDDDEVPPKKSKKKKPPAEEDDEDDAPVMKPRKKKPVAEEDDDEDETSMKKMKKKKQVEEEEDEEDVPVKKTKKKHPVEEEDEYEDDVPIKKTKKGNKIVEEANSNNVPIQRSQKMKKKAAVEESDDEDEVSVRKMSTLKVTEPQPLPKHLMDRPKLNLLPPPGRR